MSELPIINGDSYPRGLRKALGIIKSSAKQYRKLVRKGFSRAPRQVCKVCAAVFDYALVDPKATVQASLCSQCRQLLAQGYTACVTTNPDAYAFLKHEHLKANGFAGKIVPMSQENYAKIKQRYSDENQAEASGEA